MPTSSIAPPTRSRAGALSPIPDRPERAERIAAALSAKPERYEITEPTAHGLEPIAAVHDPGLITFLERAWRDAQTHGTARTRCSPTPSSPPSSATPWAPLPNPTDVLAALGYWCFETMTPLTDGTFAAARAAVDIALTAADLVLGGAPHAYALCRPPGHHAARAAYGGYCYFNNAAIAAHHLATTTGERVAVLDIDYHHGNGTQQIFYQRPDVLYASLHGDPHRAYPYVSGHAEETGSGPGAGTTFNIPLEHGVDDDAYLRHLDAAIEQIAAFDPAVLVVSLGVDTYVDDPLGDTAITTEGFTSRARRWPSSGSGPWWCRRAATTSSTSPRTSTPSCAASRLAPPHHEFPHSMTEPPESAAAHTQPCRRAALVVLVVAAPILAAGILLTLSLYGIPFGVPLLIVAIPTAMSARAVRTGPRDAPSLRKLRLAATIQAGLLTVAFAAALLVGIDDIDRPLDVVLLGLPVAWIALAWWPVATLVTQKDR